MRIYHMEGQMSPDKAPDHKKRKAWLPNTLITLATVVCFVGLARVDALTAWLIALAGFIGLVVFFYWAGRSE